MACYCVYVYNYNMLFSVVLNFLLIYNALLCLTLFDLKFTLPGVGIAAPALLWFLFAWNSIFHPFTFKPICVFGSKENLLSTVFSWMVFF